jgi:hypothetical protein
MEHTKDSSLIGGRVYHNSITGLKIDYLHMPAAVGHSLWLSSLTHDGCSGTSVQSVTDCACVCVCMHMLSKTDMI